MTSLAFPDVNVWLALVSPDHVHRRAALQWWQHSPATTIGFIRFTQLGLLRLLTTSAAMNGVPLTLSSAWQAFDRLFDDARVAFVAESPGADSAFRAYTLLDAVSPKLWADAWLLAMADAANATIVTFDSALASRRHASVLLD